MIPLSRRDRAALVLAYECVRTQWHDDASDEVRAAEEAIAAATRWESRSVAADVGAALVRGLWACDDGRSFRLLRARLALLLRVLLRADAGDDGPWRERLCDGDVEDDRSYTPLWEHARPHGTPPPEQPLLGRSGSVREP